MTLGSRHVWRSVSFDASVAPWLMICPLNIGRRKLRSMCLSGARQAHRVAQPVRTHEVRCLCDHCHVVCRGLLPPDVESVAGKAWTRNHVLVVWLLLLCERLEALCVDFCTHVSSPCSDPELHVEDQTGGTVCVRSRRGGRMGLRCNGAEATASSTLSL